jgi:transcriptional/translational regulatory protein YebC/TACO1
MFEKQGQITVDAGDGEDRIFEVAVEAGASDVLDEGTSVRVVTPVESLEEVRGRLEKAGSRVEGAEVVLEPKSFVALTGGDAAKVLKLIDALEDHDDVQRVSANFEIDDDELSRLSA